MELVSGVPFVTAKKDDKVSSFNYLSSQGMVDYEILGIRDKSRK